MNNRSHLLLHCGQSVRIYSVSGHAKPDWTVHGLQSIEYHQGYIVVVVVSAGINFQYVMQHPCEMDFSSGVQGRMRQLRMIRAYRKTTCQTFLRTDWFGQHWFTAYLVCNFKVCFCKLMDSATHSTGATVQCCIGCRHVAHQGRCWIKLWRLPPCVCADNEAKLVTSCPAFCPPSETHEYVCAVEKSTFAISRFYWYSQRETRPILLTSDVTFAKCINTFSEIQIVHSWER